MCAPVLVNEPVLLNLFVLSVCVYDLGVHSVLIDASVPIDPIGMTCAQSGGMGRASRLGNGTYSTVRQVE